MRPMPIPRCVPRIAPVRASSKAALDVDDAEVATLFFDDEAKTDAK